jgi:hypothetical protein
MRIRGFLTGARHEIYRTGKLLFALEIEPPALSLASLAMKTIILMLYFTI